MSIVLSKSRPGIENTAAVSRRNNGDSQKLQRHTRIGQDRYLQAGVQRSTFILDVLWRVFKSPEETEVVVQY